jgi:CheY-like chemotaxis protein
MQPPTPNLAFGQLSDKKRLLLVDANAGQRALRVKIMGEAGMNVDGAGDTSAARLLWHSRSYHLVLIDLRDDVQGAADLCAEIKTDSPSQSVAFLVGKPAYLSSCPNPESTTEAPLPPDWREKAAMLLTRDCSIASVRGGFQEATLRMAARRSRSDSRTTKTSSQSFGAAVRLAEGKGRAAS